jgi:hypothetical protein
VGDADGDGDKDIVLGNEDGNLILLRNEGWNGSAYNFSTPINNWLGIDIGVASAPELADVNQDGKNDLIIGERSGNLNYYQNNGNGNFTLVTDAFGSVDSRNNSIGFPSGFSIPRFYTNDNGAYQLLVGSAAGNIQRYGNILGNLAGNFVKIDSGFARIYEGENSAPLIADLNGDEINDYIIGNRRGGIAMYSGTNWIGTTAVTEAKPTDEWRVFPNPATLMLHIAINNTDSQTHTFLIFNELGQLQKSISSAQTDFSIPINDLAEGMYYIHKTGEKQTSTQKIVVLR